MNIIFGTTHVTDNKKYLCKVNFQSFQKVLALPSSHEQLSGTARVQKIGKQTVNVLQANRWVARIDKALHFLFWSAVLAFSCVISSETPHRLGPSVIQRL